MVLQTRYEDKIDLKDIKAEDLSPALPRSLDLFKKLQQVKKTTGKPIDRRLLLGILGSSEDQLKDSFLVTDEVHKFLKRDDSPFRAQELARLAGPNGIMAMNEIMQWYFERGDFRGALRSFNNRKKWGVPTSPHTYVRLFDGLAKSFEWGEAPRDVVDTAIEIFQQVRIKHAKAVNGLTKSEIAARSDIEVPTIEQFNAALSLAVRNFDNDQDIAWSLFDILLPEPKSGLKLMKPMGDSYTILLQGVRYRCFQEAKNVRADSNIGENEKYYRLLIIQKKLTDTAKAILGRALEAATPAKPPSRAEAEQYPELVEKYKRNMYNLILDIDKRFVRVFVSCFINKHLGTGHNYDSCHYLYVAQGMKYLQYWSQEVDGLYDSLNFDRTNSTPFLNPEEAVKISTDAKVSAVCKEFSVIQSDLLPSDEVSKNKVNPIVQFPPPIGTRSKSKAIFENKMAPLVDFSRPTHKETRLYNLHRQFVESKGKYGKELSRNSYLLERGLQKRNPLSPFLLQLVFEGLFQLGRYREFKILFWNVVDEYGGIRVRTGLVKKVDSDSNIIPKRYNYYQHPKRLLKDFDKDRRVRKWDGQVIDDPLLDDVLYKFTQLKGDGKTSLQSIIDFSTYVTMVSQTDIDYFQNHLLSALMSELIYWSDYYRPKYLATLSAEEQKNPPKQWAMTYATMWKVMDGFDQIMSCFYANYNLRHGDRKFYHVENPALTQFVDKFLSRLYNTEILSADPDKILKTHKWFLKCGIMFYKPSELCQDTETAFFNQTIQPSIDYILDHYKDSEKKMEGFKLKNALEELATVSPKKYANWRTAKDPSEKEWYMKLKYLYLKIKLGTGR